MNLHPTHHTHGARWPLAVAAWRLAAIWLLAPAICAAQPQATFSGTAYAKTRHTIVYTGQVRGVPGTAIEGLLTQCNGIREMYYGLPPVRPPDDVLAGLDTTTHEKFIDTNRALTLIVGQVLLLPDMRRWLADRSATASTGQPPAVPPDCAAYRLAEQKSGTLWRDGRRYDLRFATSKAIGNSAAQAFTQRPLATAQQWASSPVSTKLGQTCREVDSPSATSLLVSGGKTCIWDHFPYAAFLNWPFALSGEIRLGPGGGLTETIELLEIRHGDTIPAGVFDVPAGFDVKLTN